MSSDINKYSGGYIGLDFETVEDGNECAFSSDTECYSQFEIANHLETIVHFLGYKDRDIAYMFFVLKKKQNDIADILKKTQAAVSYDVNRIKEQVDFIIYLISNIDDFMIFLENNKSEFDTEECNILTLMFFTTSYTQSAKILGMNKISLRNNFFKILEKLKQNNRNIYDIFSFISKNLNMIKKRQR